MTVASFFQLFTNVFGFSILHVEIIDWLHFLSVCVISKRAGMHHVPFGQRIFGMILHAFGGNIIVGILLGQPPTFLLGHELLTAFMIVYLLVFYLPFSLLYSVVSNSFVWHMFHPIVDCLAVYDSIVHWSNAISHVHHDAVASNFKFNSHGLNSFVGAVIISGLSAEGGDLISSAFGLRQKHWSLQTPTLLQEHLPFGMFPAFAGAVLYNSFVFCRGGVCLPAKATDFVPDHLSSIFKDFGLDLSSAYPKLASFIASNSNLSLGCLCTLALVSVLKLLSHWTHIEHHSAVHSKSSLSESRAEALKPETEQNAATKSDLAEVRKNDTESTVVAKKSQKKLKEEVTAVSQESTEKRRRSTRKEKNV